MNVHTRPVCLSPLDVATANMLLARIRAAGKTVWPRDEALAAWAVRAGKRAVLLGGGSVLYVNAPPQAERH